MSVRGLQVISQLAKNTRSRFNVHVTMSQQQEPSHQEEPRRSPHRRSQTTDITVRTSRFLSQQKKA